MKFKVDLPEENKKFLEARYKKYVEEKPMTPSERKIAREWVAEGHNPYSNGWYYAEESGWPMDIVEAVRVNDDLYEQHRKEQSK